MTPNRNSEMVNNYRNGKQLRRGVHPDFFVKLDFEIAVDQQTRAHDQTVEGVPDSGCPPVPAGQPRPYLVNFCQITLTSEFGRQNFLKT